MSYCAGLFESYEEYMYSDFWINTMRPKVLESKGQKCHKCGVDKNDKDSVSDYYKENKTGPIIQVHHIHYRDIGREHEDDFSSVIVVCKLCHQKIHGIIK